MYSWKCLIWVEYNFVVKHWKIFFLQYIFSFITFFCRNRYYYWNLMTDQVSWLSPIHPSAQVTLSAEKIQGKHIFVVTLIVKCIWQTENASNFIDWCWNTITLLEFSSRWKVWVSVNSIKCQSMPVVTHFLNSPCDSSRVYVYVQTMGVFVR